MSASPISRLTGSALSYLCVTGTSEDFWKLTVASKPENPSTVSTSTCPNIVKSLLPCAVPRLNCDLARSHASHGMPAVSGVLYWMTTASPRFTRLLYLISVPAFAKLMRPSCTVPYVTSYSPRSVVSLACRTPSVTPVHVVAGRASRAVALKGGNGGEGGGLGGGGGGGGGGGDGGGLGGGGGGGGGLGGIGGGGGGGENAVSARAGWCREVVATARITTTVAPRRLECLAFACLCIVLFLSSLFKISQTGVP